MNIASATTRTLLLDAGGMPVRWAEWMEAVTILASGESAWTYGEPIAIARGGTRVDGKRSLIEIPPVLAKRGAHDSDLFGRTPKLENVLLFARDRHLCLYCGERFYRHQLSRDHVTPRCQGGRDVWENTATACRRCNHRKGGLTPEQAGMRLLAVPYAPNHAEGLILAGRRVLADQMLFLERHVPASRRGLTA